MPRSPRSRRSNRPGRVGLATNVFWFATMVALAFAFLGARRHAWISDDAFISFRYAENFLRGLGLVFNQGERVEGYSNFLWTLFIALGLRLGAAAEHWATSGGIACYLGSLGLLAWHSWRSRSDSSGPVTWIPVATLLGALHPDWQIFATSGLETSLFALIATLVYVLLASADPGLRRTVTAGLVLAAASMTRPEGVILVAPVAFFIWITSPRGIGRLLVLLASFLIVWVPYTAWRMIYFGDFFPNTYYAKSAAIAWYSQGAVYVGLYFARYWALLLGPVLIAFAWSRGASEGSRRWQIAGDPWRRRVVLAASVVLTYVAFVIRVGGDFMFGRFMIPVTPLLLVLFEQGIARVAPVRAQVPWLLLGATAAGLVLTPYPLPRNPLGDVRGIVYEPNYYPSEVTERTRKDGLTLRSFFEGLPVHMAFYGAEARLVYYARPQIAIECVTGLTDREIARQRLEKRGRVGHEKRARLDYVLGVRRAHFAFLFAADSSVHLEREIPRVPIDFGGVHGQVLTWDPALMDSLIRRGAIVPDFPAELDRILTDPGALSELSKEEWFTYDKLHRFYFAQTHDPRREALLRQRLSELETGSKQEF